MSNRLRRRISSASGLHHAPRKRNEESSSSSGSGTTIAIVLLLLAAGGAAIYYFMQQKKKQQALASQQVGGIGDEQAAAPAATAGQPLLVAQTAAPANPAAPAAPATPKVKQQALNWLQALILKEGNKSIYNPFSAADLATNSFGPKSRAALAVAVSLFTKAIAAMPSGSASNLFIYGASSDGVMQSLVEAASGTRPPYATEIQALVKAAGGTVAASTPAPAAPAAPAAPPPPPWKPSPYTLVQMNSKWQASANPPVARTNKQKQRLLNTFREFLNAGHYGSQTSTNFYMGIDPSRLDVNENGVWGQNSVAALDRLQRVIKAATGDPNYTPEQALSAWGHCTEAPNSREAQILFEAAAAVLAGRA